VFRTGPEQTWQSLAKGVIDFFGSIALLLAASPLFLFAAIAVKVSSPGPILFRQRRAGLNGHPFMMLKFRTMVTNAEQLKQELAALNEMSGPVFKMARDPRITRVGAFIRKTSIDELPQFWNVLIGQMSVVGPRPHFVDHDAQFADLVDDYWVRHFTTPGITGLAQVKGCRGETDDGERHRDEEELDHVLVAATGAAVGDDRADHHAGAEQPRPETGGREPRERERPGAELQRDDHQRQTETERHDHAEGEDQAIQREHLRHRPGVEHRVGGVDAFDPEQDAERSDTEEEQQRTPDEETADLLVVGRRDPVGHRSEEAIGAFTGVGVDVVDGWGLS
jgi:lipopolysaccharide/colanic/teichoic acid biosynthesis glycosyltransferase